MSIYPLAEIHNYENADYWVSEECKTSNEQETINYLLEGLKSYENVQTKILPTDPDIVPKSSMVEVAPGIQFRRSEWVKFDGSTVIWYDVLFSSSNPNIPT